MKNIVFAVLAAFVMSLGFVSCSSGAPEEKVVGLMEDMLSVLKDTHIESVGDLKAFVKEFGAIKEQAEVLEKELEDKDLSKEAINRVQGKMDELGNEIRSELQRVLGEISNLSPKELEGIDLSVIGR